MLRHFIAPGSGQLSLHSGLNLLIAHSTDQAGEARRALLEALMEEVGLSARQARCCVIEPLDPALGTHPDPAIRAAHWAQFVPPPLSALAPEVVDLPLPSDVLALDDSAEGAETSEPESPSALAAWQSDKVALQHQLAMIEGELRRDLAGIAAHPNAAREVARLGETQAEAKRRYLGLVELRRDLATRIQGLQTNRGRRGGDESKKLVMAVVFVLLGLFSTQAPGVPADLRPLGFFVVLLGLLYGWQTQAGRNKKSPKELLLARQDDDLGRQMASAEEALKEADRAVRAYCGKVGCTSPGQVIELQRRYEITAEQRDDLKGRMRELDQRLALPAAPQATGDGSPSPPVPLAQARVADLQALAERANGLLNDLSPNAEFAIKEIRGKDVLVYLPGRQAAGIAELRESGRLAGYLAARIAIIEAIWASAGAGLAIVVDDPFRFCDDEELAARFPLVSAFAGNSGQVLLITSRGSLADRWRKVARDRGRTAGMIMLGEESKTASSAI